MTSTCAVKALIPALVACMLLACTKVDPLFCDVGTPCTDPDRPFCDLLGEYPASEGVAKTCIPMPADADAGDPGGGADDRDAGANESDADPGGEDAGSVDAAPPCDNWAAPVIVASVNSKGFDGQATESPDRLSLYLTKTIIPGEDSDMVVATRSSPEAAFGTPSVVPGFDTDFVFEDAAELSSSGLELFFRRTAADGSESAISVATRASVDDDFGEPQSLGVDGFDPSISGDGLTLYFASLTGDTVQAISRNAIGGVWGPPRDVMDTPYHGVDISGDELRILLSDGPGSFEEPPVAIAVRASKADAFGKPVPINALAVPDDEALSKAASWADGERTIYFAMELSTGEGASDVYFSTCE
jgi:hypothetical protein